MKLSKALTEAQIQRQIMEWLELQGYLPTRINSGAMTATHNGKTRYFKFNSRKGTSDILCCVHGRFVAIEVKRHGGKLSTDQQDFLQAVEVSGGTALVAYSLDDVIAQVRVIARIMGSEV